MSKKKRNAHTKPGFGKLLAQARRDKGLSLEELHERTKVSLAMLQALEAEDFERLPADVYVRGFLRACCQVLSMEPRGVLESYRAARSRWEKRRTAHASEGPGDAAPMVPAPASEGLVDEESAVRAWAAAAERRHRHESGEVPTSQDTRSSARRRSPSQRRVSLALVLFLILVVLTLAASYFMNQKKTGPQVDVAQSPPVTEAPGTDWTG